MSWQARLHATLISNAALESKLLRLHEAAQVRQKASNPHVFKAWQPLLTHLITPCLKGFGDSFARATRFKRRDVQSAPCFGEHTHAKMISAFVVS